MDEETTLENLKILLNSPVGYNSCEKFDPFYSTLTKIAQNNIYPNWVYKYFQGYGCIERLIILSQKNRYINSNKS